MGDGKAGAGPGGARVRGATRPAGCSPVGYPAEMEDDVLLEDGRRVHLRPVRPEDWRALRRAVERADPETLRWRFLGGAPPRTEALLRRLVTVDYVRRFALAAFSPGGEGVGIARYEGEQTWPVVEVAVVVDREWRGVGLGRVLVRRVLQRASQQGASGLTADFFSDNDRVQSLLREAGLPEHRTVERGVVTDVISLPRDITWSGICQDRAPPSGQGR